MKQVMHYKNEQGQVVAKFKLHKKEMECVLDTEQEQVLKQNVLQRLQDKDRAEDRVQDLENEIAIREKEIEDFTNQIMETSKEVEELEAGLQEFDNIFTDLFVKEEESQEQ